MTRGAVLLMLGLSACGFSSEPVRNNPSDAGSDAAIDSPGPITCGDLRCDPNATCTMSGDPSCECKSGFDGNGMTCDDVNECAVDKGGCKAAACVNTPGSFQCTPKTCAEARSAKPNAPDGDTTLYVDGDLGKPWTAYCADMATSPIEYLTLTGMNYSQYTSGGDSAGSDVRTTYTKVRLDPVSLRIDIGDQRFSTSTGGLQHAGEGINVKRMPFGVAMDCKGVRSNTGMAAIDLGGTAFALTGRAAFSTGGFMPAEMTRVEPGNRRATLTGGGKCGWNAPVGTPINPFDDNANGVTLQLVYVKP